MVHMTMRSVKPSCRSVSAHTRAAGPAEAINVVKNLGCETKGRAGGARLT